MAKRVKYLLLARFGNGMYVKTIRIFTDKNALYKYLKRKHEDVYFQFKHQYQSRPEWAKPWEDFEYFVRHFSYKYYIGETNSLDGKEESTDIPKNIPCNKFYDWLISNEPL